MRYRYRFAWKCAGVSAVLWFSTLLSAQPGVTFSPISLSFGNQVVGVKSSAHPASLSIGANCTINVTFFPSATGSRNGNLTVNDDDPRFLQTVSLSGTGVVASTAVTVSPGQGSITPI